MQVIQILPTHDVGHIYGEIMVILQQCAYRLWRHVVNEFIVYEARGSMPNVIF